MAIVKTFANVKEVERLQDKLAERINDFLRTHYGFSLSGGSRVVLEDGTMQYYIGVDSKCIATLGSLPNALKREFNIRNLYINGSLQ